MRRWKLFQPIVGHYVQENWFLHNLVLQSFVYLNSTTFKEAEKSKEITNKSGMIQVKVHVFKKINEISQIMEWVFIISTPKLIGNFVYELIAESRET